MGDLVFCSGIFSVTDVENRAECKAGALLGRSGCLRYTTQARSHSETREKIEIPVHFRLDFDHGKSCAASVGALVVSCVRLWRLTLRTDIRFGVYVSTWSKHGDEGDGLRGALIAGKPVILCTFGNRETDLV